MVRSETHLVANQGLLYGGEILKRAQQHLCVFSPPNVLLKVAPELLRQCEQDLVFVIDRVLEEGYQFIARALWSQCEGNR